MLRWLELGHCRFYDWRKRYGQENKHNSDVPRPHWAEPWEREAILAYHDAHPLNGYRRLSYMMLDEDVVAVSPSTVCRVLKEAKRLDKWSPGPSKKGTGFHQPKRPHEHWHADISCLNIAGVLCCLCSVLDGFSRAIIHWEIREQMKEPDVDLILQRAYERYPEEQARVITDNGPQFVSRDFHLFVRQVGMTHVRTSPYYPQSNGKIERWHKTLKRTTIRPKSPSSPSEARAVVAGFVEHYNQHRLHATLGYLAPADMLAGRAEAIQNGRKKKLEAARLRRAENQKKARRAA